MEVTRMKVIKMPRKRKDYCTTVGELIEELEKYDKDAYVMLDNEGNTYSVPRPMIWNENDPESPVAFFIGPEIAHHMEDVTKFVEKLRAGNITFTQLEDFLKDV
jgi:hypothetical protein